MTVETLTARDGGRKPSSLRESVVGPGVVLVFLGIVIDDTVAHAGRAVR